MTPLLFLLRPHRAGQTRRRPTVGIERLLQEAAQAVCVRAEARQELKRAVVRRIGIPAALQQAVEARPTEDVQARVKAAVLTRIAAPQTLWDRVRASFTPSGNIHFLLRARILSRLQPVTAPPLYPRFLRWTAAFALVALAVRLGPSFFIASPIRAASPVLLIPTQGEVSVLIGGLWQPVTAEVKLQEGALVRTGQEGYATLILHDDGVLRLAPDTAVTLHDLADRPERTLQPSTLTLERGTLWAQALIPAAVGPGWTLRTAFGDVQVNEGSTSLTLTDDALDVTAWDRLVNVTSAGTTLTLTAGEKAAAAAQGASRVRSAALSKEEDTWVNENLERDAVHRREIALLQQERRAQNAGILPTSALYPAKRVAEAVDMLFTFGEGARTQKRLEQASTRLNEAAALLITGSGTDVAEKPLEEYRQTLLAVATGSGQDLAVQTMVQQQMLAEVADTAAALPDDEGYLLKKTVLETSAAVPNGVVNSQEVREGVVVDTLASLTRRVQEGGNLDGVTDTFKELLPSLSNPAAPRQLRKEAQSALEYFAETVRSSDAEPVALVAQALEPYLPKEEPAAPAVRHLTEEEVASMATAMVGRIFTFKMPRSRYNQLLVECRAIEGHPDERRILNMLQGKLPPNGLAKSVRTELQRARERVEDESR
ncbi:MAG: DUF5667 domain-containing protein [Patescibacteria group bacterium]